MSGTVVITFSIFIRKYRNFQNEFEGKLHSESTMRALTDLGTLRKRWKTDSVNDLAQ